MSTVTITDSHQISVTAVPVNPGPLSALVKYAQDPDLSLILLPDLVAALKEPINRAAATPGSLGAQIGKAFSFGAGQPQFSLTAGVNAKIHVNANEGATLFGDDLFGSQIMVDQGQGYVSLAFTGTVTGKASDAKSDITLGFEDGISATFEFFRAFPLDDAVPTVGQALGEVISNFVMPADVTDLNALQEGEIASCSGLRHLKVSGAMSAAFSPVALASPNLPLANIGIGLNGGASFGVHASFEITSKWQIRSRMLSGGVVELGFYSQQGSDWDVAMAASAGIDARVANTDLLTTLIDKLSKDPEADQKQLAAAGLSSDQIKAINAAISNSIDRSVHASLSLELTGLRSGEAAFLFHIELNQLDEKTAAAVTAALDGDLAVIDRLNPDVAENGRVGPGLLLVRSILTRTRKSGATVKINLLGLLNFLSLSEFVSQSQVLHEPVSGDLIFKETASGERIEALTLPQSQTKLRKAIFDSLFVTTTYRSCGLLETMQLHASGVHFALHSTTNEHTMSDYLDWFIALRLLTAEAKTEIMGGFTGTGASTCIARVELNDEASQAMFFDAGRARSYQDFVHLGREVLQTLLMPGDKQDADRYRRDVLSNDGVWDQFDGQTTIGPVMAQEKGWALNDPRIQAITADYSVIVWWAHAMSSTAKKALAMQDFVRQADPKTIRTNKAFLAKLNHLQKHVMNLVRNSAMSFDQPFGLIALAWAAGNPAVSSGVLHSPAFDREFKSPAPLQRAAG